MLLSSFRYSVVAIPFPQNLLLGKIQLHLLMRNIYEGNCTLFIINSKDKKDQAVEVFFFPGNSITSTYLLLEQSLQTTLEKHALIVQIQN